MQPDFATGLWAVVTAGNEKYICTIATMDEKTILEAPLPIKLEWAFKLIVMDMPMQGPRGELGIKHIVQCVPLDAGMHPAVVYVTPTSIRYFKDMQKDDRDGHENIVRGALETLERARAQAAGIQIPNIILPPNVRS